MATSEFPTRTAIGGQGGDFTYGQLYTRAGVAASEIAAARYGGVAYIGTNSDAFAIAVFGAAWAGVPIIPINYRLGRDQIIGLLDQHEHLLVIADSQIKASLDATRHHL
ncbi:MAG TPA: AMP-binding protein, partial [Candidatus Acidoferrum sp.]|nr:AMP-binding protein [Candidatus Acidoferrum sp.]